MEKQPYYFNRSDIETGRKIAPRRFGDLLINLKGGKWFRIILFPNNIKKVRSYLKATNWI